MKLHLFNTGGTFNKRYDPIKGDLVVPSDDKAVGEALAPVSTNVEIEITGLIYKDSLQMDDNDRAVLREAVEASEAKRIVVVHGTDTMDASAAVLAAANLDKTIVFTGAMVPFSIDPVEATANLTLALWAARSLPGGIYIAMHGLTLPHERIRKNYDKGIFEAIDP